MTRTWTIDHGRNTSSLLSARGWSVSVLRRPEYHGAQEDNGERSPRRSDNGSVRCLQQDKQDCDREANDA